MQNTPSAALHERDTAPAAVLPVSEPFATQENALAPSRAIALHVDSKTLHADAVQDPEARCFSLYQSVLQTHQDLPLLLSPPAPPTCSRHDLTLAELLHAPHFFASFLRAVLRVSAMGQVLPILPCTHDCRELSHARLLLDRVATQLRGDRLPFDETLCIGLCISTAEGVERSRALLEEVDLLFLDTTRLSHTVTPLMPLLDLIGVAVGNARMLGRMTVVYGTLATDPRAYPHLLAMGADAVVRPFYNSDTISDKIHAKNSCKSNNNLL